MNDEFQAKSVDEQIEQLAHETAMQSANGHMLTELQNFYASDSSILENVWQRLEQHQATYGTLQSQPIEDTYSKGFSSMYTTDKNDQIPPIKDFTHRTAQGRWPRMVSTLAAVLIAMLLVGSVIALFNSRNHNQLNTTNATPGIVSQATSTATVIPPRVDCSYILDTGEHAVCADGEETALYMTKSIADEQFTLVSAYADLNRVMLKYTVAGPPISEKNQVNLSTLTIQGHLAQNGPSDDEHHYDTQKKLNLGITSFSDPLIPVGTTELHTTVTVEILDEIINPTSGKIDGINSATSTISFTIPFHSAKYVATPNLTVNINGDAVTLTQVVITDSQTELILKSAKDFQLGDVVPFQGTLTLPFNSGLAIFTNLNFSTIAATDHPGYLNGWHFIVPESLLGQPSIQWTFTLSFTGGSLGSGSGKFQFIIPIVQ